MSNQQPALAVTRVANACVVLELAGHTVLTDPWFTERWYLRRGEPLGLPVDRLPRLAAIAVTSFAANHWDVRALRAYRHKASTPVFVSAAWMVRQARRLGYPDVTWLRWGETRELAPGLTVEVAPAGRTLWWRNNAYVFSGGGQRVFFGGEIADVARLTRYRADHPATDVALLPTNGLRPLLGPQLVMNHEQAVAGAHTLGANVLLPVHDAHARDPLSLLFRRHGSAAEAEALAARQSGGLDVVCLPPGQRWEYGG